MTPQKPREIALELLLKRQQTSLYIESLLEEALQKNSLKPEDRRFLQEITFGVIRWQATLDYLIQLKTAAKPQTPRVQNLLRLALYQMFWLDRVPSYAAVNETVEIAKTVGSQGPAKFINALLRAFSREADLTKTRLQQLKRDQPALGYSHPDWLFRKWLARWGGSNSVQLMEWDNSPPPVYARWNSLKGSLPDLLSQWQSENVEFTRPSFPWIPESQIFELRTASFAQLPSFLEGRFYIQDPSTLLAVEQLDPLPGEQILDLCSAPGGKTTLIAARMNNTGRILAHDLDPARLKLVQANATRLGVTNIHYGLPADAIFDRILIDAPCSNTGVIRRRVDLRWRVKPDEIQRLAQVQRQLLGQATKMLRSGGTLVYSTCSLEREENSAVVREFLDGHPSFRLESETELLPFRDRVDGAFVAKFRLT